MDKSKLFNDPIHGYVELESLLVKIIDCPEFQRLRELKQLGGVYYVYPGASHKRFEHCIGTSFLAGELLKELLRKKPDIAAIISKEEILCVKIAGLCHDLGHGPFSHAFDGMFISKVLETNPEEYRKYIVKDNKRWTHEDGSVMMFQEIWNNLKAAVKAENLDDRHKILIQELIDPPKPPEDPHNEWPYKGIMLHDNGLEKAFIYEIVSNARTRIDVDKFDYMARDSHHLGIKSGFDHRRYLKMAEIGTLDNGMTQIDIKDKSEFPCLQLFHTRATLHREAYKHPVCSAVELMITDALLKALPFYKVLGSGGKFITLVEAIRDPVAYLKLRDNIYYNILDSCDPDLKPASQLLQRIENRKLYKLLGTSHPIDTNEVDKLISSLKKLFQDDGFDLDDIEFKLCTIDYGDKTENPVTKVHFLKKNGHSSSPLSSKEMSPMLPRSYSENRLRVFYKNTHEEEYERGVCLFNRLSFNQQGESVGEEDLNESAYESFIDSPVKRKKCL